MGLLKLRPWGRYLSIIYAFLSIAIKVFAVIYVLAFTLPVLNELMRTHQQATPQGQMMINIMRMIPIMSAVMPIVYMIYPIIVLIIMLLPSTTAAFHGQTAYHAYDDFDEPADVEGAD